MYTVNRCCLHRLHGWVFWQLLTALVWNDVYETCSKVIFGRNIYPACAPKFLVCARLTAFVRTRTAYREHWSPQLLAKTLVSVIVETVHIKFLLCNILPLASPSSFTQASDCHCQSADNDRVLIVFKTVHHDISTCLLIT